MNSKTVLLNTNQLFQGRQSSPKKYLENEGRKLNSNQELLSLKKHFGIFPLFILFLIVIGNGIILFSTEIKMKEYPDIPPFRMDDFTRSYRISSSSRLVHLWEDPKLTWTKLGEGKEESDINIELRLTHVWNGNTFQPRKWNPLIIGYCSPSQGRIELILREAINVDKELRLPDDISFYRENFSFPDSRGSHSLSLEDKINLYPSLQYPDGIYILVLRMKFESPDLSTNPPCLNSLEI